MKNGGFLDKAVSWKWFILIMIIWLLTAILIIVLQASKSSIGEYSAISALSSIIVMICYLAFYIMVLIHIIRHGARVTWIVTWIVCFLLFPLSLLFIIIYLSAGKNRMSEKTLLEKAKVIVNIKGTDSLDELERPVRSKQNTKKLKFCSECGEKIKVSARFCENCGYKFHAK